MKRADVLTDRKEDLKQPSEDFTGRRKELEEFRRRLQSEETEPVWYLHGFGGVGKSELLKTLRRRCRAESYPCAYVDLGADEAKWWPNVLREIAVELGITELPSFNRCYNRYDRLIKAQPTGADVVRELGGVAGSVATLASLPDYGMLDKAKEGLASQMSAGDLAFLGRASDELFDRFTEDLCAYTESDGRRLPIVLLFDTYEQASVIQTDNLDLLIRACVGAELPILFVIAGRDDPERLRQDKKLSWPNEQKMDQSSLGNLPEAEEFLSKRKITHPELVKRIMGLTGGFPMFLRMACEVVERTEGDQAAIAEEFPERAIDRKKVAEYLLDRILNRLSENHAHLRRAIRLLGLARWFDRPILALLMDKKPSEVVDDWNLLTQTSLVQPLAKSGRWKFHDPIRESILSEWKDAGDEPLEYHRKLAEYHLRHGSDFARVRERLYHRVTFEPRETIQEWVEMCEALLSSMRIGDYDSLLADSFAYLIPWDGMDERARAHTHFRMGYALGRYPTKRPALVEETIRCYSEALRVYTEKGFPQDWAMTQNNLGVAYRDLPTGDRGENLEQAIRRYEAALRVRTEKDFPQDWAETRFNMGLTCSELSVFRESVDPLRQALKCFRDSVRGFASVGHTSDAEKARSVADQIEEMLRQLQEGSPSE